MHIGKLYTFKPKYVSSISLYDENFTDIIAKICDGEFVVILAVEDTTISEVKNYKLLNQNGMTGWIMTNVSNFSDIMEL